MKTPKALLQPWATDKDMDTCTAALLKTTFFSSKFLDKSLFLSINLEWSSVGRSVLLQSCLVATSVAAAEKKTSFIRSLTLVTSFFAAANFFSLCILTAYRQTDWPQS